MMNTGSCTAVNLEARIALPFSFSPLREQVFANLAVLRRLVGKLHPPDETPKEAMSEIASPFYSSRPQVDINFRSYVMKAIPMPFPLLT